MFIVFGSPRSGTTLLKETLNLHPDLFIPMQTTLISTSAHLAGSISNWSKAADVMAQALIASDDFPVIFGPYFSESDLYDIVRSAQPSLAGVLQSLYGELAKRLGKLECGDKSPDDLLSIRKLEEVGLLDNAQMKFIHIVRDVRGSVSSLLNVDWAPAGIEEYFPRIWNYTNLHLYHARSRRSISRVHAGIGQARPGTPHQPEPPQPRATVPARTHQRVAQPALARGDRTLRIQRSGSNANIWLHVMHLPLSGPESGKFIPGGYEIIVRFPPGAERTTAVAQRLPGREFVPIPC